MSDLEPTNDVQSPFDAGRIPCPQGGEDRWSARWKRYFRRVEVHEAPRFRGSEVMHTLKITPQGAEAIARLIAREVAA